jgi:hypothetical protein
VRARARARRVRIRVADRVKKILGKRSAFTKSHWSPFRTVTYQGATLAPLFTAEVNAQLRLARRLCDCRWNRWAWEVVGFE